MSAKYGNKLTVILGAGASADFGVPILSRIFQDDRAKEHLDKDQVLYGALNEIFWSPRGLTVETSNQGPNVEDMLTAFRDWEEDAEILSSSYSQAYLSDIRNRLYKLIKVAVHDRKSTYQGDHLSPIIKWAEDRFNEVTWATFNWDPLFELSYYSLRGKNPSISIDLDQWGETSSQSLLLKLHGSITWWNDSGVLRAYKAGKRSALNQKWEEFKNDDEDLPLILEPSYYKYRDPNYAKLNVQWQRFGDALKLADVVLSIGYSLPDGDSLSKSVIVTSVAKNVAAKWYVVEPFSEEVFARYRRIVGSNRLHERRLMLRQLKLDVDGLIEL